MLVLGGVFERFPNLKVGVIEQGAIWVPSWMRQMESAFDAFARSKGKRAIVGAEKGRLLSTVSRTPGLGDVFWLAPVSGELAGQAARDRRPSRDPIDDPTDDRRSEPGDPGPVRASRGTRAGSAPSPCTPPRDT